MVEILEDVLPYKFPSLPKKYLLLNIFSRFIIHYTNDTTHQNYFLIFFRSLFLMCLFQFYEF